MLEVISLHICLNKCLHVYVCGVKCTNFQLTIFRDENFPLFRRFPFVTEIYKKVLGLIQYAENWYLLLGEGMSFFSSTDSSFFYLNLCTSLSNGSSIKVELLQADLYQNSQVQIGKLPGKKYLSKNSK